VREVAEESGIQASVDGLLGVQAIPPPWTGQIALLFRCRFASGELTPDGRETDAARYFTAAELVQQVFSAGTFRAYTSSDVTGVELGGALKNVIALAAGILDGMGFGHTPRAALITRGLAETARLGVALGAEAATFAGLAGMGDLILTATGQLSRNRSLGVELGKGRSLAEVMAERRTVAEGVRTAHAAVALAGRAGVELPIAAEVSQILFGGKSPRRAIADLMERELKAEQWR